MAPSPVHGPVGDHDDGTGRAWLRRCSFGRRWRPSQCRARIRDQSGRCLGEGSAGPSNTRAGAGRRRSADRPPPARAAARPPALARATWQSSMPVRLAGATGPGGARAGARAAPCPFAISRRRFLRLQRLAGPSAGATAAPDRRHRLLRACGGRRPAHQCRGLGRDHLHYVQRRGDRPRSVRRALWALEGMAPAIRPRRRARTSLRHPE